MKLKDFCCFINSDYVEVIVNSLKCYTPVYSFYLDGEFECWNSFINDFGNYNINFVDHNDTAIIISISCYE